MNVVLPEGTGITGKLRGVTGRPQKEKRPTVEQRIAAGMDQAKKIKKTWMIHLPHLCLHVVWLC